MKLTKLALATTVALLTTGAVSAQQWEQSKRTSARIIVDGIYVNWGMNKSFEKPPVGGKAALASFTKRKGNETVFAGLSLQQRIAVTQKALAAHKRCSFRGFDQDYHNKFASMLGSVDNILVFAVKC